MLPFKVARTLGLKGHSVENQETLIVTHPRKEPMGKAGISSGKQYTQCVAPVVWVTKLACNLSLSKCIGQSCCKHSMHVLLQVHDMLVGEQGVDPSSPLYYTAIESHVAMAFPQKWEHWQQVMAAAGRGAGKHAPAGCLSSPACVYHFVQVKMVYQHAR